MLCASGTEFGPLRLSPVCDYLREWMQETNQSSEERFRKALILATGGWPEFIYGWKESTVHANLVGNARGRLVRLGIDNDADLLCLDGKGPSDCGPDDTGNRLAKLMRWAEVLRLLRTSADGIVQLDPFVAELLMQV